MTKPAHDATHESIADLIPKWYEGGTQEQMLDEALAQIRTLEARLHKYEGGKDCSLCGVSQETAKHCPDSVDCPMRASVPSAIPKPTDRDAIIEECADLADQKLDHYSGTECTYRGDVADAIRGLKGKV